jgi:CheY-like chemotaxis protein/HPt (histidine-containing phosphotransfer) domain-containing protein
MGGTIGVTSELGKGATFHVELPLSLVPEPGEQALAQLDGVHVLLVSADVELVKLAAAVLEARHARVSTCRTLEEVLPCCAEQRIDVVVTGYDWRRGEHFDLAARARAQGSPARFIAMVVGRRLKTRIESEDMLTLDVVPLTDSGLIHAVAIAAGRASPEVHHGDTELIEMPARLLGVDEARAAGTLILVAEDNPTNRDVIGRQLRMLGQTFEMAEDGKQALAAWRSGHYAVLLTDCHMPVMDGFELTAAIRAEEQPAQGAHRFPIVAITANALQGEAERCLAAGMDAYMAKPIDMKELRRMLKRFVPELHSAAELPPALAVPDAAARALALAVDPSVLKGMFGDDMATFQEILREFVAPSRQIAEEIRSAANAQSAAGLKQAAHKLKSSARSIGANQLADLCFALEGAAEQEQLDSVSVTLQQFDDSIAAVFRYIESVG